jgi:hypothetical protein
MISHHHAIRSLWTYILNVDELVFSSGDVGDIHVVGLFVSPNLNSDPETCLYLRKERYPRASCR